MERIAAVKKLGKMLGKGFGYRVDNRAPMSEERERAKAASKELAAACQTAETAMTERRNAILATDSEYQRLVAEWKLARKTRDEAFSLSHRYKFTVGTSNGMFFLVKAEGDSWEDVIGKLSTN